MKSGRRLPIFLATTAVMVCLLGVVSARQTGLEQGSQMTEAVFSDIQILKGMPVDTFFDVMGMFASSMGEDCTYCHSDEAVFRHEAFADPTPRIQRARQMIVMMNALNATYFGGEPRVSCFTCHGGNTAPVNAPRLSLQYGLPDDNPNVMDFPSTPGARSTRSLIGIWTRSAERSNWRLCRASWPRGRTQGSIQASARFRWRSLPWHRISARRSSTRSTV